MPIDRTTNNTARPLKPTLATARTAKTPVAPRLAPSVASANCSQTTRTPRSNAGATPRVNTALQEDVTPVKSFIHSNVTPRSSSRKSRAGAGSANSTPNGTPSGTPIASRPASTLDYPPREQAYSHNTPGPSSLNSAPSSRPRSVVGASNYSAISTLRPPLSNIYNHAPDAGTASRATPMFFHANDARVQESQPPQTHKKAPVFFYANGDQDETSRSPNVPSPPLSSVGRSQPESKFFHADSLMETRNKSPSTVSASPEPVQNSSALENQHSLRPPSPSKENMHLSYRKGASQVLRPNLHTRNSALSILSGVHTPDSGTERERRRSSATSSAIRLGHAKSASLSSIDSPKPTKKMPSHELSITPSPLQNEKRILSGSSLPESLAVVSAEATEILSGLHSPSAPSPTKPSSGQSVLEHMNELAANARRERKVLDLEISNNSLLAINRSLEREIRKQKAELRRFRRMSRAGRFSSDTIASDSEEFSAVAKSELEDLSDVSEEADIEDVPENSSESSFDESAMSSSALAERDAVHRLRDEKRLRLDLSKHQELLLDSQKMNQSLKRCLNWTEELIKDGQKALAYRVRVSDVQLGGRVLNSEERPESDHDEESKALLSPWSPPHRATDPMDDDFPTFSEHADRDSGVDLGGLKPLVSNLQSVISPLASPTEEVPSWQSSSDTSPQTPY